MTADDLTPRQQAVLSALVQVSGGEWIEAAMVASAANRVSGVDPRSRGAITAVGAGRMLSRLADLGLCEKRWEFYMHRYRSKRPVRR